MFNDTSGLFSETQFTFLSFFPSCQSSSKFSQERIIFLSGRRRFRCRGLGRGRRLLRRRSHRCNLSKSMARRNFMRINRKSFRGRRNEINVHSLKRKRNSSYLETLFAAFPSLPQGEENSRATVWLMFVESGGGLSRKHQDTISWYF